MSAEPPTVESVAALVRGSLKLTARGFDSLDAALTSTAAVRVTTARSLSAVLAAVGNLCWWLSRSAEDTWDDPDELLALLSDVGDVEEFLLRARAAIADRAAHLYREGDSE